MKDYERITERTQNGAVWYVDNANGIRVPYYDDCADITKMAHTLADLEDKIESGEIGYVADKDAEIARLTEENKALREQVKNSIVLPYIEKSIEYTGLFYKNEYGLMDHEVYFNDCFYGEHNDIRGDKYAEMRLAKIKEERK